MHVVFVKIVIGSILLVFVLINQPIKTVLTCLVILHHQGIDSVVDGLIYGLFSHTFGTVWGNTDMFHLKLLTIFSLSIAESN